MRVTINTAYSIQLETCWLPLLKAANCIGEEIVSQDALKNPLELVHNPDGSIKFSKNGRLCIKQNKEITYLLKIAKDNFKNYNTKLEFKAFIESLKDELEHAIAQNNISLELKDKIRCLFQPPLKKGYIQILPGSYEMGKNR